MEKTKEVTLQAVKKKISVLRARLLGLMQTDPTWSAAVLALEYAISAHEGMYRKDGVTPYILHPVEAAMYVLTLSRSLLHPAQTVAVTLLHDCMEDCGATHKDLSDAIGLQVADGVECMSKVVQGVKKSDEYYFGQLANSPIASIAKLADRINNQGTMNGVFTPEKQLKQVQETVDHILPLAKTARRRFPQQELAYENGKLVLKTQISLVRAMHANLVS